MLPLLVFLLPFTGYLYSMLETLYTMSNYELFFIYSIMMAKCLIMGLGAWPSELAG